MSERFGDLLGRSVPMRELFADLMRIAPSELSVLIEGETGTGKELVADSIHRASPRAQGPYVVFDCSAVAPTLAESELFGHEKGAFTGAATRHTGLFREAQGGTLLLDEIGELPQSLQVKLLRALQERSIRPVGGTQEIALDVRVLAATNRDVEADVAAGKFRQDLYYRLNVIRLNLPALRERREDVPLLAERFVKRFAAEMGKEVTGFTTDALRALEQYEYPGNVRELENVIERAVALSGSRVIGLGDLPRELSGQAGAPASELLALPAEGCELEKVLNEIERRFLVEALERAGGVRKNAAKLLGVTFRSLRYRLQKQGLGSGEELASGEGDDEPEA
jgi:two-component system response regulator PilR (NtrC family)